VTFPRLLSGDFLFSSPIGSPTPWFAVLTAGFALVFLLSAFFYWKRAMLAAGNPIMRRLIRRASTAGMWTGGIGVVLAALRYIEFPFLSAPILIYLLVLIMIGIAGYFVYDISERYPVAMYQLQQSELHRRFRPAARPAREPQRPKAAKVRGKQRRR
jgi:Zn-dependent protease with chaperone function